ncbi:MAG: PPC domain-containing protein [Limisphaerales bacterium]
MRPVRAGQVFALVLAAGINGAAQLPSARLHWVFPPGAPAGSTNEITVAGADLDDLTHLFDSDSRIAAAPVSGVANRFRLVIPSDMPPGLVDLRVAGRFGVSNPRAFAVGGSPEVIVPSTNTSAATAILLPLGVVASSRVMPNSVAWYRFEAAAGQRLLVQAVARELDSRLVPDLAVTDAAGRELALARRREWLDFTAPAAGTYLLRVHDQTFRGGDDFHCRVSVTEAPWVEFAAPLALRIGETNQVTLFGRQFANGRLAAAFVPPPVAGPPPVELLRRPAAAALAEEAVAWWPEGSASRPLFLSTENPVLSAGPDAQAAALVAVTPPCDFAGFFPVRGGLNGVTFTAGKGDVLWLEVFAERLGLPCDPHAVVQRQVKEGEFSDVLELADTDANLGDREFDTRTSDAAARFEAPADGAYRVLVRDRNLSAARPVRYPYLLRVRPAQPGFALVTLPAPPPRLNNDDRNIHLAALNLRRGETLPVKVIAFRRDGFDDAIELAAKNLPPGVTAAPGRIAAGQAAGWLLLTAADELSAGGSLNPALPLRITGTTSPGGAAVSRMAVGASVIWPVPDFNNEAVASRLVRDPAFGLISAEAAPIVIEVATTNDAPADGRLALTLHVTRGEGFAAAFKLKPAGHPALDKLPEVAVAEKATNAAAELNLADAKLPPGPHTLWLSGSIAGKYRSQPEAVALADAELKRAEAALASASDADKPKAEARKQAAEAARKAAEERAKPRDVTVAVFSRPFTVHVPPPPAP